MSDGDILIVDDEPDVVRYLSAVLENHDYAVRSAHDTTSALKQIAHRLPSLICLDIMMPEESGLSLFVKLRRLKKTRTIPVIVISGMESEREFNLRDFVEDTDVAPPEQYIEKPIDVEAFVGAVERLAGNRRSCSNDQRKDGSA